MTTTRPWMLYGANGYSGRLIAEEAVRRGHRPVLAGRSADKVRPLAEGLGLSWAAFDLGDISKVATSLEGVDLVLHAAGPFLHTSEPMVTACLERGVHYLDITGEMPVLGATLERDAEARRRGVALIGGVGFDVVPTDCLAKYVSDRLPNARFLDIAFASIGKMSTGTAKTVVEMSTRGNFVRREGALIAAPFGGDVRSFRFTDKERNAMAIPWGDLETAYLSTAIPNITVYAAVPKAVAGAVRLFGGAFGSAMKSDKLREFVQRWVERNVRGPGEARRERDRSYVYACARDAEGKTSEAWLETIEGYAFTATASVLATERTLAENPQGALTPSLAFGADFVLSIPGTSRTDSLPGEARQGG